MLLSHLIGRSRYIGCDCIILAHSVVSDVNSMTSDCILELAVFHKMSILARASERTQRSRQWEECKQHIVHTYQPFKAMTEHAHYHFTDVLQIDTLQVLHDRIQ